MERSDAATDEPRPTPSENAVTESAPNLAAELATARERLAFYESFDSLIQENVRQSGILLRQVAAEREAVETRLGAMRAELEARLADQRAVLADLAGGLGDLETYLGSLSSRVNDSLARLSEAATSEAPQVASRIDHDPSGDPRSAPPDGISSQPETPGTTDEGVGAPDLQFLALRADLETIVVIPAVTGEPDAGVQDGHTGSPGLFYGGENSDIAEAPAVARRIDVIIHGVPKAATALSIQRHLQELAAVEVVEVREYVSGVLRFQVMATEFGPEDLMRWEGGDGMQTITAHQHVVELRLATTETCSPETDGR
ncbi:MAG: hypothetical protein M3464_05840 [Chloroflexota bacterium]|nr:hypothetical protein [Chloroflexota bacterium]